MAELLKTAPALDQVGLASRVHVWQTIVMCYPKTVGDMLKASFAVIIILPDVSLAPQP